MTKNVYRWAAATTLIAAGVFAYCLRTQESDGLPILPVGCTIDDRVVGSSRCLLIEDQERPSWYWIILEYDDINDRRCRTSVYLPRKDLESNGLPNAGFQLSRTTDRGALRLSVTSDLHLLVHEYGYDETP